MTEIKEIFFITGNAHKFAEVSEEFKKSKLLYTIKQLDLEPIEIQADSLKEVALYKLNSIKDQIEGSFFVEDAGFFVDIPLNGFPGVYSSYVFKTIGNEGILNLISDFKGSKAHFSSCIALYHESSCKSILFEGKVYGKVSPNLKGTAGFGYDPIFIPNEDSAYTFAELSRKQKNKISHRGKALKKLIEFLRHV
jgi:XTP/dITP diphosphohydrolase